MNISLRKPNRFSSLFIFALLGCCAILTLSSCSKKASVAIIGKWQVQEARKEIVEFRKDGVVITSHDTTAGPPGNTRTITQEEPPGKYTFTDSSHMNLQINTGGTNGQEISASCEVHIHGDQMDITVITPNQRGQHKVNFKRLK